ncbi:MAG: endonuclease III [Chloroflexi bacterium]|nr:endonuclease III [Chloroflexota bacterium]
MPPLAPVSVIIERLESAYGSPNWHPRYDPMSELVYTILSQNTSDKNSQPAFQRLRSDFPTWEDILEAPVAKIGAAIRSGGLWNVKAPRIKQILQGIREQRGPFDLDFLRDMPLDEAKTWLRGLPGVGPKTAACVLLFSLGRPALPVDTHVHRVAWRLGLIDKSVSREKSHEVLEGILPEKDIYRFHVLFVQHGRQTCKAQRPLCPKCVVNDVCPYYLGMQRA